VGCGGGGGSTSTEVTAAAGPPLPKQEFISKATAVCKAADRKAAALKAPSPSDLPALATFVGNQIEIGNQTLAELTALSPPPDLRTKYDQYLTALKSEIGVAGDLESAAEGGDAGKVQAVGLGFTAARQRTDVEARSLGLKSCAGTSQAGG
jgi:hypothetical protein